MESIFLCAIKKRKYLACFLMLLCKISFGQYTPEDEVSNDEKNKKESNAEWKANRWQTGGNFGLLLGSVTYVDISPIIGYRLKPYLIPGAGITYIYYSDNVYGYNTNIYGGRVFLRGIVLENFLLHGEYEILSFKYPGYLVPEGRVAVPRLLLGGGISSPIGNKSRLTLLLLYNVLDGVSYRQKYPIYMPNPDIRVGFMIGL